MNLDNKEFRSSSSESVFKKLKVLSVLSKIGLPAVFSIIVIVIVIAFMAVALLLNFVYKIDVTQLVDYGSNGGSNGSSVSGTSLSAAFVNSAVSQKGSDGNVFWDFVAGGGFIDGNRTPWCACFVSWNIDRTTYNNQKLNDIIPVKSASVLDFVLWGNANDKFEYNTSCSAYSGKNNHGRYTPKQGDLIIFDWDGNFDGTYHADHIGIVQKTENDNIVTIEGNSSQRVRENTYALNDCRVVGFVRWY